MIRQYFIGQAQANSYDVIDLKLVFSDHFAIHNQAFEAERDGHWSKLGHDVVATALGALYERRLSDSLSSD